MNGVTKFIIGGVATSLMAMASHATIAGAGFVDQLQGRADAAVAAAAIPGVSAAMVRSPMLTRNVVLSGDASQAERDRLIAALKDIPGIGSVTWATDGAISAPAPAAEVPATAEAVANCQADVDGIVAGKEIRFATGATTIHADSDALLGQLAEALKACAGAKVEVAGHTDAQGDAGANLILSNGRAEAVVADLAARGVPADRLVAVGYGETQPKVATGPDDANPANRRIEFKVSSTADAAATPAG
jgi:Outer membrane protein and related peptidoglycan-associated (lipo)proteins